MPIWGVVNQKGGVGKTTTAVNLAASLALAGKRVLLVDSDPQGNATTGLGIEKQELESTLYEAYQDAIDGNTDTVKNCIINLDKCLSILPATLDLAGAEPLLQGAVGKEMILREMLDAVRDDFDWIIVDSPPALGLLTINVLSASDRVLVPMQCEFYALEGLSQLMKTVEIVKKRINPGLEIGKVLLTMYDPRSKLNQQVAEEIRGYFGAKVAHVPVPRNVRLSEAPSFGKPAVTLFPSSKGAEAYKQLAAEVLSA